MKFLVKAETAFHVAANNYSGSLTLGILGEETLRTLRFRLSDPFGEKLDWVVFDETDQEVFRIQGVRLRERIPLLPVFQKAMMFATNEIILNTILMIQGQYRGLGEEVRKKYDMVADVAEKDSGALTLKTSQAGEFECEAVYDEELARFIRQQPTLTAV